MFHVEGGLTWGDAEAHCFSLQALHALLPHLIEEALTLVEVGGNLQAVLQQLLAGWIDMGTEGALCLFFYHTCKTMFHICISGCINLMRVLLY